MQKVKKYALELGEYDDPVELFGAYQVLIRSITESKFSEESFDDRIIASSSLANIAEEIIEKMDLLGQDLGIMPYGSQRRFMTITSREDRPYQMMLRKIKSIPYSDIRNFLLALTDIKELEGILDIIFSPYQIDHHVRWSFLEDLDHALRRSL